MAGKITHILKNGEVRDSMEGYIVPVNEDTMPFYMSIVSYAKNKNKKIKQDETA